MSETSREARRAMRAKAHRLATTMPGKVDCSDYGPEQDLHTTDKTGMRPVSRRAYRKGGKVVAVEGEKPAQNAGRKSRAAGGKTLIDDYQNRDAKEANEKREGVKHVGALKTGGRAGKAVGGSTFRDQMRSAALLKGRVNGPGGSHYKRASDAGQDVIESHHDGLRQVKSLYGKTGKWNVDHKGRALPEWAEKAGPLPRKTGGRAGKAAGGDADGDTDNSFKRGGALSVSDGKQQGTRPTGGRLARKSGGKTDINIIIGRSGPANSVPGQPAMGGPGGMPVPVPVGPPGLGAVGPQIPGGTPNIGAAPPMPMPGGPPMPRKRGGRASYKDMDAASGGGEGRLEKTEIAKHNR